MGRFNTQQVRVMKVKMLCGTQARATFGQIGRIHHKTNHTLPSKPISQQHVHLADLTAHQGLPEVMHNHDR